MCIRDSYQEVSLAQILNEVTQIAGLNLVSLDTLSWPDEPVSVRMNNVRIDQVLDRLLEPDGHSWYRDGHMIHVVSQAQSGDLLTDINLQLENIQCSDIRPLLDALKAEDRLLELNYHEDINAISYRAPRPFAETLNVILRTIDDRHITFKTPK